MNYKNFIITEFNDTNLLNNLDEKYGIISCDDITSQRRKNSCNNDNIEYILEEHCIYYKNNNETDKHLLCEIPLKKIKQYLIENPENLKNLITNLKSNTSPEYFIKKISDFNTFTKISSDNDFRNIFITYDSPHIVVCFDIKGSYIWTLFLSTRCCGSSPVYLQENIYVVSSGCNPVLTWFDLTGKVIKQLDFNAEKKDIFYPLSAPIITVNKTIILHTIDNKSHFISIKGKHIKVNGIPEFFSLKHNIVIIKNNENFIVYDLTSFV